MKHVGHTSPNSSPTPEDRLVTRTETLDLARGIDNSLLLIFVKDIAGNLVYLGEVLELVEITCVVVGGVLLQWHQHLLSRRDTSPISPRTNVKWVGLFEPISDVQLSNIFDIFLVFLNLILGFISLLKRKKKFYSKKYPYITFRPFDWKEYHNFFGELVPIEFFSTKVV